MLTLPAPPLLSATMPQALTAAQRESCRAAALLHIHWKITEQVRRPNGWMFWGCLSGHGKGPGIFWEKEWGTITSESYCERILPAVSGFMQEQALLGINLQFMQDNAPAHGARSTKDAMLGLNIAPITWPANSPDLNPIERCWDWMKDYVDSKVTDNKNVQYPVLRAWVQEAWDALPDDFVQEEIRKLPTRMRAVVEAGGLHTRF